MPLSAIRLSMKSPASSSRTPRKSSSRRRAFPAPFPPRNSRKLPAIMPRVFPCSPMLSARSNTLSRKPRPKRPFSSPALSIWSASSATIGSSARKSPRARKNRRISPSGFIEHLQRRSSARHSLFGDCGFVGAQHLSRPCRDAAPQLRKPRFKRLANIMKTKGKRPASDGKGVITHPLVAIIMGSGSDWDTMKFTSKTLGELGVPHETRVVSAHRTPDLLFKYASNAEKRGIEVIIAGAGGAAHLPGMTASMTVLPVLGVPVESKTLKGLDSLLSIAQMPSGIPVGTLAIGRSGAVNAALLAAAILGAKHPGIREAFRKLRAEQTGRVLANPDPSIALPSAKKKGKRA